MTRALVAAGLLTLTACAGTTPPPAVETRVVTKTVEVARPCAVTIPQRPAKLARPLPGDSIALAALLTAKLLQWDGPGGYGDRADAAIKQCTTP